MQGCGNLSSLFLEQDPHEIFMPILWHGLVSWECPARTAISHAVRFTRKAPLATLRYGQYAEIVVPL